MEINITKFFNESEPSNYSASRAERGDNAGPETWAAANEAVSDFLLLDTEEKVQALRDYARGFGAWEQKEIDGWTIQECNALLIQMISGDIREVRGMSPATWDWVAYEEQAEKGSIVGRIGRGSDDEIYYYLGD